jgi:preprotein translocase subunit SecD
MHRMILTIRLACWVTATLLLAACDMNKVAATVRVELESPTPEQTAAAAVVLQNRLSELVSSFSKVTATPSGTGVDVVFAGEAPPDELIRSYASMQGVMRMFLADSPINVVVTDRDVEQATASRGPAGPVMNLMLRQPAGERMLAFTRRNVGKVMVTSWDRKTESRATIRGVFGAQFQTTGLDFDAQKLWVVMLRHGRLPVAVRSVEIRNPQG